MVERSGRLDRCFAALADPTRRAIVEKLAHGEAIVTELAAPFDMSLNAVSKHLKVLADAGLLSRRRVGRTIHCRLNAKPMRDVMKWVLRYREFWTLRLDALERYLDETREEA